MKHHTTASPRGKLHRQSMTMTSASCLSVWSLRVDRAASVFTLFLVSLSSQDGYGPVLVLGLVLGTSKPDPDP